MRLRKPRAPKPPRPPRLCAFQVVYHPHTGKQLVFALDNLGRLWWTPEPSAIEVTWLRVKGPRVLGDPDLSAT